MSVADGALAPLLEELDATGSGFAGFVVFARFVAATFASSVTRFEGLRLLDAEVRRRHVLGPCIAVGELSFRLSSCGM